MTPELGHLLPRPGPVWGHYPLRPADDTAAPRRALRWRGDLALCRSVAGKAPKHADWWLQLDESSRAAALETLRIELRRDGLQPALLVRALGVASGCATQALGMSPRPTQLLAAAVLLDNRMAEMATGEGKTLAIGLAAAVAALAGIAVHVVTANEYLARRDAEKMSPLFQMLGLRVAALSGVNEDDGKRAVYRHAIVYATAKELAFDFLRDRQNMGAAGALERVAADVAGPAGIQPLMRGLCMALLDEADSILLDEAEVPLILSRNVPHAARRAFLWQALALARQLEDGRDFVLQHADRMAALTPTGEHRLAGLASGLGGPWLRPRYRREAVVVALAGLHVFRRNQHYLVREGTIELLDEVTGRVAAGRVWSRGLHTVVALKEGLSPPAETETVAQTTFQRFFQRYWRLCGISGTLREADSELREVYGAPVARIPLYQPCRRVELPRRRFERAEAMFDAAVKRLIEMRALGRPVLVGTDSVADSLRLSERLHAQGVTHEVLNALNDAQEAGIVAAAGRSGSITVATRMAGRGTDITLDDAARAAGGLHVLCCQNNLSRRLDRQLAGRAGRQGDPGSVEMWSLDGGGVPAAMRRWVQWREERRRTLVRRGLLEQDLHWERRLAFAGVEA